MKSILLLAFMAFALGSCSNNAEESSTTSDSMTVKENAGSSGTSSNGVQGNSDTLGGTGTGTDTSMSHMGSDSTGKGSKRGTRKDSL